MCGPRAAGRTVERGEVERRPVLASLPENYSPQGARPKTTQTRTSREAGDIACSRRLLMPMPPSRSLISLKNIGSHFFGPQGYVGRGRLWAAIFQSTHLPKKLIPDDDS